MNKDVECFLIVLVFYHRQLEYLKQQLYALKQQLVNNRDDVGSGVIIDRLIQSMFKSDLYLIFYFYFYKFFFILSIFTNNQ